MGASYPNLVDANLVDQDSDALVADALAARGVPERVNYATGVLLDAGDFGDEQTYLRGRLARALAAVCGHGTLAGLRVSCPLTVTDAAGTRSPKSTLEVHVAPGLALDRLGRLIEVRATQCIAITRWLANLEAQPVSDLDRVRLIDALRDADAPASAPDAGRVLVLDVFLRFVVCPHGRTPAFAAGPFNATDVVVPSRLADGFEMTLQVACAVRAQPANPADTSTVLAVPAPRSSALQAMQDALAGIADATERAVATRAYALASVLDAWPEADAIDPTRLPKLREHANDADWDRVLLGRVTVPVAQATPGAFPTLDAPRLADPGADRDLADNTLRPIVFNPLAWRGAI